MPAKVVQTGPTVLQSPRAHRKRAEILQRRALVASLFLNHTNEFDIARALNVSQATVSADLRALQAQWYTEAIRDINEHKARIIAELDIIIGECTKHLHDKNRDKKDDSIWITQWRTTLLQKATIIGLSEQRSYIDITTGGKSVGVKEVIIELPPGNVKQLGPVIDANGQ